MGINFACPAKPVSGKTFLHSFDHGIDTGLPIADDHRVEIAGVIGGEQLGSRSPSGKKVPDGARNSR